MENSPISMKSSAAKLPGEAGTVDRAIDWKPAITDYDPPRSFRDLFKPSYFLSKLTDIE